MKNLSASSYPFKLQRILADWAPLLGTRSRLRCSDAHKDFTLVAGTKLAPTRDHRLNDQKAVQVRFGAAV